MNAEQITTEVVVGSDDEALYDDEDDDDTATVSSVATISEVRVKQLAVASFSYRRLGVCHPELFYFSNFLCKL